jgi:hypothetical protein
MEFEVFLKEKITEVEKVTFRGMKNRPVIDGPGCPAHRFILFVDEVVFFSLIFCCVNAA